METAALLAAETQSADQREARGLLLHELAEADERVRGDEVTAAKNYLAAYNQRPSFRPPLDGLIRLYARRRSVPNLVKLADAVVRSATTPRERADAHVARGELLEDRLQDLAGARAEFDRALEADPDNRAAWLALERDALRQGDRELLVRALERQASLTQDQARKARLLMELGHELSAREDPAAREAASRAFRDAASLPLGRWRALLELERFAERVGRPDDAVFALEGRALLAQEVASGGTFRGGSGNFTIARLGAASPARDLAADLWSRAARLRLDALKDPEGARRAMDHALALKPDDAQYWYFATVLADQAGETDRAGEFAARLLAGEFGDPGLRAGLHLRVAESAALRGDLQTSADSLREALALNPEGAAARGALIEQLVVAGDGPAVVAELDRLAEVTDERTLKAGILRSAALYGLALSRDVDGALLRLRVASELDPDDAFSRRALATLLARQERPDAESARAFCAAITALLATVTDADERVSWLLRRYFAEHYELGDLRAAAATAEELVAATGGEPWAMESAAHLWAASGMPSAAARWALELSGRGGDLPGGVEDAYAWRLAAARWRWAAGQEADARALALEVHRERPGDAWAAAYALRLAVEGRDAPLVLDVATRASEAAPGEEGTRWLLLASVVLGDLGAEHLARQVLEAAGERDPGSAAVRAARSSVARWRGDTSARASLADAALEAEDAGSEELALGVELSLARAFLEHDVPGALEVLERVLVRDPGPSVVVTLLRAIVRGALDGPDAEETVSALQGVLPAMPSNDPLRAGIELEVARALGASSATRDQAAAARELVDEDRPHMAAPRLLALLDAIQREDRRDVPFALARLEEFGDEGAVRTFRGAALAALRAVGDADEARALALRHADAPSGTLALSELVSGLDHAHGYAEALAKRVDLAAPTARRGLLRAAAGWKSLAGDDGDALERAETLLRDDPADVVALDVKRVAGRRLQQWGAVVDACAALAARVKSPSRAAALWEEAGVVALDALKDPARARAYLASAFDAAPEREIAYRKLREVLEAQGDRGALEVVVTHRVMVVPDPAAKAELYWEQARLRRALGLREAALESANQVVVLAPDHVAARALVAEVHASSGRLAEAADALVSLAGCKDTPPAQRRMARLGAIDLFERVLGRPERAIEQLEALVEAGNADEATLERGVAVATAASLWPSAKGFAALLAERAPDAPSKARANLRVAHLLRDKLGDHAQAQVYARRAHEADPVDLEVLRTLQGVSGPEDRLRHARRTIEALREALRTDLDLEKVRALTEAARSGGDTVLEHQAVRLARALGDSAPAPALLPPAGASLRDPSLVLRFRNPADSGRAAAVLETVLPDLGELSGLSTDAFKVGRSERIRGAHPARTALQPYLSAAGFQEFELYVGGPVDSRLAVIPGDPVAVVLGRGVALPLDEASRFELVRCLLLTARGVAPLAAVPVDAVVLDALAALAYAGLDVAGGTARFEARIKPVGKALTRRARKAVAENGRALAASVEAWDELSKAARGALATARRGAVVVTGAVASAFEELRRAEGLRQGASWRELAAVAPSVRELAQFVVSDAATQLARETGVDGRR